MTAPVNSINYVCEVGFATRSFRVLDFHREACFHQVNARHTHRPEDRIVVAEESRKSRVASELWVYLLRRSVNGIACMQHGRLKLAHLPIRDRSPNRISNVHGSVSQRRPTLLLSRRFLAIGLKREVRHS